MMAIPRGDVKPAARALLERFGSLGNIFDAMPESLAEVKGVGPVAATILKMMRDLGTLYLQEQTEYSNAFNSLREIEDYWRHKLGSLSFEVFEVACVDIQNRLIPAGEDRVAEGDLDSVQVSPRRVIEFALRQNASGLILIHNHPGGDPSPTRTDRLLTEQLVKLAQPLKLRILDHLIIARHGVFSFRREGLVSP